jgi:4-hydroxymandelate oxidase
MNLSRRDMVLSTVAAVGSALLPAADAQNPQAPREADNRALPDLVALDDFERVARQRMTAMAYEYIAGGAADEITLRWNREEFNKLRLRPRVLQDVETLDTSTQLFGQRFSYPILLAPTALHRLVHPEGEVETARGAAAAGATLVVSSLSTRRLADIAPAAGGRFWFQLYGLNKQRHGFVRDVVQEVQALGGGALCVTVDSPVIGPRNRQARAGFHYPDDFETPYYPERAAGQPKLGSFTWDDVSWLRSTTKLPILLKGIMNPADAKQAVGAGVQGIIVSNHGGRDLDTLPATISALPMVAQKVAGRVPLLMDGGIRRGTDVLKALALGARAVLIGRPYLYGLATGGSAGVARVVEILRDEFKMAMALTGRRSLREIDPSVVAH